MKFIGPIYQYFFSSSSNESNSILSMVSTVKKEPYCSSRFDISESDDVAEYERRIESHFRLFSAISFCIIRCLSTIAAFGFAFSDCPTLHDIRKMEMAVTGASNGLIGNSFNKGKYNRFNA